MPVNNCPVLCGNARKREIVRCTIASVIVQSTGSCMSSISLHGKVAVKPAAKKALGKLVAQLQPDSDDVVAIDNNVLIIHIGNCDAPSGFHQVVGKAVCEFCEEYATEGAVFDFDGSTMVVGPGAQAKKTAHAAHLVARIQALTAELDRVLRAA